MLNFTIKSLVSDVVVVDLLLDLGTSEVQLYSIIAGHLSRHCTSLVVEDIVDSMLNALGDDIDWIIHSGKGSNTFWHCEDFKVTLQHL